MAGLDPCSVDAIVCDPPYSLRFMARSWDDQGVGAEIEESHRAWTAEALRVLKPGGHLLAFGGTRTYHRLACAVEDAGFEIRDTIAWMYGAGFPKSLDVSKAIDKAAGVERAVVGQRTDGYGKGGTFSSDYQAAQGYRPPYEDIRAEFDVTAAATPDAERWDGWGTALKPAHEPIVVARKPLTRTVAANVLEHGTGALNVDGTRIEGPKAGGSGQPPLKFATQGRWPANVVLDEEAARLLDAQTGELVSGPESDRGHRRNADREARRNAYGGFQGQEVTGVLYGDRGGASRFFYCAKASRAERNAGLSEFPDHDRSGQSAWGRKCRVCGETFCDPTTSKPRCGHDDFKWTQTAPTKNHHPTVKPISLMRWLVRLVTPPGGLVLDPFTGSGTTGIAAGLEGFRFLGFERDEEYARIAEARIRFWWEHGEEGLEFLARCEAADREREAEAACGQTDLLAMLEEEAA